MKKAVIKDALREIKKSYKRFISILLMAFLGVGFFAGIRASSPDMLDTIDTYYKNQNVYDIQVLSTLGLTSDDINAISKIENVEHVDGNFETDGQIEVGNKEVIAKVMSLNDFNTPVLIDGSLPSAKNECVVEERFLTVNNKNIGDTIELNIKDMQNDNGEDVPYLYEKELKIVGTVQSPMYISVDRGTSTLGSGKIDYYMYIPKSNVQANSIYTNIYVKVKDANKYTTSSKKYEDCVNSVKTEIENPKWYVLDRNRNAGYSSFIQDTDSIANIGKVFPVIFFIVAALISLTSMTRMVEEQRTQIGTLKALGYNKLQITSKYVLYASLACIIGSILGMSVGFVLLPKIVWKMYSMMYQIGDIQTSFNFEIGSLGFILIVISILGATIYAVIKELIQTPATLMRPKSPKMGKRVFLEKVTFIWKRLSFSRKVTVRNIFRYKKRFLMTIIGIMGCTALIVTGFGIRDSIRAIMPDQYEKVFNYDLQINLKADLDKKQKQDFINSLTNDDKIEKLSETYMSSISAINGSIEENVQIIVPNNNSDFNTLINLTDVKSKNNLSLPEDGVLLTDKAAQLLGVEAGDNITLKDTDENETNVKVTNVVENYVYHYIYMSKSMYENLYGKSFDSNVILTKDFNLDNETEDNFVKDLMNMPEVASVTRISTAMNMMNDTMKSLNYVVVILIVSAGLLAFVVLYNLSNVNISERIRELATIKVLGFYDKEVYLYITRETIILTAIGLVLGLVAGYFLDFFILETCEINMLRFRKFVAPLSFVFAALITILFTIIVNIVTYFALKKINMIESLKSVE